MSKRDIHKYRYCVDDKFLSDTVKEGGVCSWTEALEVIQTENAECIYGIGEAANFLKFEKKNEVGRVFIIYDAFEFWKFEEKISSESEYVFEHMDKYYKDELSLSTIHDYIGAILSKDGSRERKNCPSYGVYFNELVKTIQNGIYIDVGAYEGETIRSFRNYYKEEHRRILALEPDDIEFGRLSECYSTDSCVELKRIGACSNDGVLRFDSGNGQRSQISKAGNDEIEVRKIDSIVEQEKVAYIKIGTFGGKNILRGASVVIQRNRPLISVIIPYSCRDIIEVPKTISNICNEYKFYLRHHSITSGLLVLYAVT